MARKVVRKSTARKAPARKPVAKKPAARKPMSGYGATPQNAKKAASAGARSAGSYNRGKVRNRSVVSAAESHNSKKIEPMFTMHAYGYAEDDDPNPQDEWQLQDNYTNYNRTWTPKITARMNKERLGIGQRRGTRKSGGIR